MTDQPTILLNDDRRMPQLGLGTYRLTGKAVEEAVTSALDVGYWLIDTASVYENEQEVGRAIGEWSDIFLTTKIWNDDHGFDKAKRALAASLERLGRSHVDLALIHWPCPSHGRMVETWRALIEMREEGLARSIGVSNFRKQDLERIIDATGEVPAVNQIELHPHFQQRSLRAVHEQRGIATQCWSPLGQGKLLEAGPIAEVARATGLPAAAVVLAWHLDHGLAPIPKASSRAHQEDNFTAWEVELSEEQVAAIDALDSTKGRIGPDPAEVN